MSSAEQLSDSDPLAEVELHGRPVRQWIEWLSRDGGRVPCSRYGNDSESCSYWAVACEYIYCEANGSDNEPAEALNYYQGLVVNDSSEVLELVLSYFYAIPEPLKEYLDYEDNGMNMRQQATLYNLCQRYSVKYDAEDYYVYPADQWMMAGWAEGQVGGIDHVAGSEHPTIYVGVSPEGQAHS